MAFRGVLQLADSEYDVLVANTLFISILKKYNTLRTEVHMINLKVDLEEVVSSDE
jgi:hypothetical protein